MNNKDNRQELQSEPKGEETDPDQSLAGIKILLVEDEPDIAELLDFVLKMHGAEVIGVINSANALKALSQEQPDVLICNMRLPDLSGDKLLKVIRSQPSGLNKPIPAIALTSYTREFSEQKVQEAGFDAFLTKPLTAEKLVETILDVI